MKREQMLPYYTNLIYYEEVGQTTFLFFLNISRTAAQL